MQRNEERRTRMMLSFIAVDHSCSVCQGDASAVENLVELFLSELMIVGTSDHAPDPFDPHRRKVSAESIWSAVVDLTETQVLIDPHIAQSEEHRAFIGPAVLEWLAILVQFRVVAFWLGATAPGHVDRCNWRFVADG